MRNQLVKPKTLARYESAVRRFSQWLRQNGREIAESPAQVDVALSSFVEALWECGDPKGYADDAVSGLLFYVPRLRGGLPASKRLLRAWARAEVPNRAPPFSVVAVYALVAWCLQ